MSLKIFVKRIAPFLLTFSVGIFIASFFITIAAPSFRMNFESRRRNHRQYDEQRERELRRLQEENMRLREQQNDNDLESADFQELKYAVPPPPMPPAPPKAPLAPRHID